MSPSNQTDHPSFKQESQDLTKDGRWHLPISLGVGNTIGSDSLSDKIEIFVPCPNQCGTAILHRSCLGAHLGFGASIFRAPLPPKKVTIFCEISPNLNVDSQFKLKESAQYRPNQEHPDWIQPAGPEKHHCNEGVTRQSLVGRRENREKSKQHSQFYCSSTASLALSLFTRPNPPGPGTAQAALICQWWAERPKAETAKANWKCRPFNWQQTNKNCWKKRKMAQTG